MKKIILAMLIATSMVSVACSQVEQESKESKIVEEVKEVQEIKEEKIEEDTICEKITKDYGEVYFDGCETYILKVNKSSSDYIDQKEPCRIAKQLYDEIDALTDKEFYFMLATSDNQNVSIFRTNDGVYYTNCFGETIEDVTEFIK